MLAVPDNGKANTDPIVLGDTGTGHAFSGNLVIIRCPSSRDPFFLTCSSCHRILGLAIAAIYNAGAYRMSTWVPFLWGLIQALVVIMGSYSTVTTIL